MTDTSQDVALAKLEATDDMQRQALERELGEFIARMKETGLPGITRIDVTDGYKTGWRYVLTPKYAKENHVVVAGWELYVRDIKELRDNPKWSDLLNVLLFALTVDGELLEKFMWMPYGLPGLAKTKVGDLSGKAAGERRWYLKQLSHNLLTE